MKALAPLLLAAVAALASSVAAAQTYGAPPPDLKTHLDRLVRAYPDFISGYDDKVLIMKDGTRFPLSDGRSDKSFDALIETPDIDDMFYVRYPKGTVPAQPPKNSDPGRVRFGPLFVKMYGDCTPTRRLKNLRTVKWVPKHNGGTMTVTTVNGVDKALEAVSRELEALPNDFVKYLKPSAGSYNCRPVQGSSVTSVHSYGAAIDLNFSLSHYWRNGGNLRDPKWQNKIPVEIIRVFEKHGFIWGGYWYHYDTMHFEYRPELMPD